MPTALPSVFHASFAGGMILVPRDITCISKRSIDDLGPCLIAFSAEPFDLAL